MTSSICTHCGLCCDGTLLLWVPIEETEAEWARMQQLNVAERNRRNWFALPCRCFRNDGKCGTYESRPAACRRFRCRLLRRVESEANCDSESLDMEPIERALETIARVKALRDLVNSKLPGPKSLVERLIDFVRSIGGTAVPPDAATLAFRRENRDLINAVLILSLLLNREFRDQDEKPDSATPPDP